MRVHTPRKPVTRPRKAVLKRPSLAGRRVRPTRRQEALPDWGALQRRNRRVRSRPTRRQEGMGRLLLGIGLLGVLLTLYVGHVLHTQHTLEALQAERNRHLRLQLKYNRLKGNFDRQTGPAIIYRRAARLGLVQAPAQGKVLYIEE